MSHQGFVPFPMMTTPQPPLKEVITPALNTILLRQVKSFCKVFVQPISRLFSVYFPDTCVFTEIKDLSTVLDSVGSSQSGFSVALGR